jgi:predicted phosphate transport protein (TIGR00153 family)
LSRLGDAPVTGLGPPGGSTWSRHPNTPNSLRLIPRDAGFFDLFNQLAGKMRVSASLLRDLFADPARRDHFAASIKAVEHEADAITHEVSKRLDKSFITPLDREDIHNLAQALDNVVDLIDGTARRVTMFHIAEGRASASALAEILIKSVDQLEKAVLEVKNPRALTTYTRMVKQYEEEGDSLYHEAVGQLFAGRPDPLEVLKWKELYDTLEHALDTCQTVAIVLESISLKNS